MKIKVNIVQLLVAVLVAVFAGSLAGYGFAAPAEDGQQWILLHHESQGEGDPSWTACMPDDAWSGHDDHEGDWKEGPFNNNRCEEDEPTSVPPTVTPVPTDVPTEEPTATPTDVPGEPTPTDEPPAPTPTHLPDDNDKPERLPNTGSPTEWDGRAWQEPSSKNTWYGHNGVGGIATSWTLLNPGDTFEFYGMEYVVTGWFKVAPESTWVIDGALDMSPYGLTLITCTGYNTQTGEWAYRLVVYAVPVE